MRPRRYRPRPDPIEAEHIAMHYGDDPIDVDAVFFCRHGIDKCQERCGQCDEEARDFWDHVDREWEQREDS